MTNPHNSPGELLSKSTSELLVRELNGGKSNTAFDYIVYGLRIGFEESSIVQEKQDESYIPSFRDHRERYAKYPELRAYNSLERFTAMESSVRGVKASSIDLSRARALKEAIHEYDPATDLPTEKLFGRHAWQKPVDNPPVGRPTPTKPVGSISEFNLSPRGVLPVEDVESNGQQPTAKAKSTLPCFPVSEKVEAGDVVVMDPSREGYVVGCFIQADPMVVGIAAGPGNACATPNPSAEDTDVVSKGQAPVVTSGVTRCKVDAGYGPINRGDLLVASPTPGHAMKAPKPAEQGTVIGKALESLDAGTGLIKVLVMLR